MKNSKALIMLLIAITLTLSVKSISFADEADKDNGVQTRHEIYQNKISHYKNEIENIQDEIRENGDNVPLMKEKYIDMAYLRAYEVAINGQGNLISNVDFIKPTDGYLTSRYGQRFLNGHLVNHFGIDIGTDHISKDVRAAASGIVKRSLLSTTYGNYVIIQHMIDGVQYQTLYAHMTDRNVKTGDIVTQGQVIGHTGQTGSAQGVHLHFEVHQPSWNYQKSNSLDPLDFVNYETQ